MNLRVPDALTTVRSEKYIVSIRFYPGGLSFAGVIPSEEDSFFYTETAISPEKPLIEAIKDIFFAHPFLAYTYKHTYVICVSRQYTLVPATIFDDKSKEQLMSFVFLSPEKKTLYDNLDEFDSKIVFGIQPEVYEFLARSLIHPIFIHSMTAQLTQWRRQSLIVYPKQLFVVLHEDTMDAACFYRDSLLFVNSFMVEGTADMLYYILYIWKQTGMDQQLDKLILYADTQTQQGLKEDLQTYLLQVEYVQPRLSDTGLAIPSDIMALFQGERNEE